MGYQKDESRKGGTQMLGEEVSKEHVDSDLTAFCVGELNPTVMDFLRCEFIVFSKIICKFNCAGVRCESEERGHRGRGPPGGARYGENVKYD